MYIVIIFELNVFFLGISSYTPREDANKQDSGGRRSRSAVSS